MKQTTPVARVSSHTVEGSLILRAYANVRAYENMTERVKRSRHGSVLEGLAVYLADPGKVPGLGPERGERPIGRRIVAIAKYTSPHGSVRYVAYVGGAPVSALQLVTRDRVHASIANVFTVPERRREGWANVLLARARKDFRSIKHAREDMLSGEGKAWRDHSEREQQ
jgi:hypothetical protein